MKKILKKDLVNYLNKEFNPRNAEDWDFVGFSIKSKDREINKILIVLDVNSFIVDQAIKNKVNLIISFHPFCFAPKWSDVYKYDFSKKELVGKLKKNNIDVFSIHTNFDKHKQGTKYWLFKQLNWEDKIIKNFDYFSILKLNLSFDNIINILKDKLKINNVLSNFDKSLNTKIQNIAFWPGSGDVYELIKKTKDIKLDLIITSDLKWNDQQVLNSQKYNFVIIPHKIEDIFVDALEIFIKNNFNNLKVIKYKLDDFIKAY